jgi:hypothetical protein
VDVGGGLGSGAASAPGRTAQDNVAGIGQPAAESPDQRTAKTGQGRSDSGAHFRRRNVAGREGRLSLHRTIAIKAVARSDNGDRAGQQI